VREGGERDNCPCRVREGRERVSGWNAANRENPSNAVARGGHRKMQQRLRLLLEPLHCMSLPHFEDAGGNLAPAGISLKQIDIQYVQPITGPCRSFLCDA
jgi:hypothetical protein